MPDHTVRAFDADLANLARMVAEMHEQVEEQLKDSVEALIRNDDRLVKRVLALDESNAALNRNIEANVILVLTRRQPVAHDLRFIIAIWETAIELSRVSGIARGTVNRAIILGNFHPLPSAAQGLRRITNAAVRRLREVVNSLVLADTAKADGLSRSDYEVDSVYSSVCRELLTYMMADPSTSPSVVQLLFSAKSIESIGDSVTNIADAVHYFAQGQRISRVAEDSTDALMTSLSRNLHKHCAGSN
jgi:phosphate transport system protein